MMPQRITPSKIVTVAQDGELHITLTLDLNINLNSSDIQSLAKQVDVDVKQQSKKDEEKFEWVVPEFDSASDFQFGKEI